MYTCVYTLGSTATRACNSTRSPEHLRRRTALPPPTGRSVCCRDSLSVLITTEILAILTDRTNQRAWLGHVMNVAEEKLGGGNYSLLRIILSNNTRHRT